MAAKYWTCRKCGYRNQRAHLLCRGEVSAVIGSVGTEACTGRRPPKHVPKHATTLRDNPYAYYREVNEAIHGAGDNCGVCGAEPKDSRNLQREHDHVTGQPRGLACWRCNRLMPKQFGLTEARAIVAYLERVEAHYSQVSE
jgi:hypothetical protein